MPVHVDENLVTRPLSGDLDFKELFQEAISARAGLSFVETVDANSDWTPSLLAEAILAADPRGRGVDVRTVQNWFQDNDKGISSENIVCLACVFGAGDPNAIVAWRKELRAANKRLASKRRSRRKKSLPMLTDETKLDDESLSDGGHASPKNEIGLVGISERVFTSTDGLGISIVVWAGYFLLCLVSFFVGNYNITYTAGPGLSKQVGFFWSVSWPIECLLLYPASFLLIAHLVSFWKREGAAMVQSAGQCSGWDDTIDSLRFPFWVAALVAFALIFAMQWGGVYLLGLTQEDTPDLVDWILVARFRPDAVSLWEALFVSFIAFFYSGLIYWLYFTGLLLLFAISDDFSKRVKLSSSNVSLGSMKIVGEKLQTAIFRCTVIGILVATAIQLNAVYLKSDGESSFAWLTNDFLAGIGTHATDWAYLGQSSVSSLTSAILLLLHVALYAVCTVKVHSGMRIWHIRKFGTERPLGEESTQQNPFRNRLLRQLCTLGILCLNFSLLGRFVGFTLLLFASLFVAVAGICWFERGSVWRPRLET